MNYQNFGNESMGPDEAVYLYSLWSVVKAIERVGIFEFDMNSSFCQAIFQSMYPEFGMFGLEQVVKE